MFKELFTITESENEVKMTRGESGLIADALGGNLEFGSPSILYVNKIKVGTYDSRKGIFTSSLTPDQVKKLIASQQGVKSAKEEITKHKFKAQKAKPVQDIIKIFL